MDAPIDDLSLLSEDFAKNAIPNNRKNETIEYLVKGAWVPENVYLAWLEEQEEWPNEVTTRRTMTKEEVAEKYPNMHERMGRIRVTTNTRKLNLGPDLIDPKSRLQLYFHSEPVEPKATNIFQQQLTLYKELTIQEKVKLIKSITGSPPESSPSSESSTTNEDHIPKSPDNG